MNNNKKIFLLLSIVFFSFLAIFCYITKKYDYLLIIISLIIISLIFYFINYFSNTNPKTKYVSSLNNLLKTYDGVLVEIDNIPELSKKNIILVKNITELIDAQAEIKKPIYFYKEKYACIFLLIDMNEALIYVFKLNGKIKSSIDFILLQEKEEVEILSDWFFYINMLVLY